MFRYSLRSLFCIPGLLLLPSALGGQTCLGFPVRYSRPEVGLGVDVQNDGFRTGAWGHANFRGMYGARVRASFGEIDNFAENGIEVGSLLARSLSGRSFRACVFAEFEYARQRYRHAYGQTKGEVSETWAHAGLAVAGNLAKLGEVVIGWHAAPELTWRVTHVTGRTTYIEPEVHVLVTTRQDTGVHISGRALLTARLIRVHLVVGLRTRPRRESDLLWSVHLGFVV